MIRTNHWRRLTVVSGAILLTLLVLGIFSSFRAVLGIEYGFFSALLDVATIITATVAVIRIECWVADRMKLLNENPIKYTKADLERLGRNDWGNQPVVTEVRGRKCQLNEDGIDLL